VWVICRAGNTPENTVSQNIFIRHTVPPKSIATAKNRKCVYFAVCGRFAAQKETAKQNGVQTH